MTDRPDIHQTEIGREGGCQYLPPPSLGVLLTREIRVPYLSGFPRTATQSSCFHYIYLQWSKHGRRNSSYWNNTRRAEIRVILRKKYYKRLFNIILIFFILLNYDSLIKCNNSRFLFWIRNAFYALWAETGGVDDFVTNRHQNIYIYIYNSSTVENRMKKQTLPPVFSRIYYDVQSIDSTAVTNALFHQ